MRKVYVLGSGFSVQGGLPTIDNFFQKVNEKKGATDLNSSMPVEREAFDRTLTLQQDKSGNRRNMEDAFSAISEDDFDFDKSSITNIEQLRNDFLYTVCRTMHLCWTDGNRDTSRCLYRRFLEHTIEEGAALVTFNYDVILDNLFFDMNLLPEYGFELHDKNAIHYNVFASRMVSSGTSYLKMHGSQKWFKCKECGREFVKIDQGDNWPSNRGPNSGVSSGENCLVCNDQTLDFLIIPPLKDKEAGPQECTLKKTWDCARREIEMAEEIVFVGFSFPMSDENVHSQFKEWIGQNFNLRSVSTVDPNACDREFRSRFEAILQSRSLGRPKVTFIPKTFLGWFIEDVL